MTRPVRPLVIGAVAVALAVLVGANAHLVYVALESQPECVAHLKSGTDDKSGAYSAARSSC
jgi:hypothetical protein